MTATVAHLYACLYKCTPRCTDAVKTVSERLGPGQHKRQKGNISLSLSTQLKSDNEQHKQGQKDIHVTG